MNKSSNHDNPPSQDEIIDVDNGYQIEPVDDSDKFVGYVDNVKSKKRKKRRIVFRLLAVAFVILLINFSVLYFSGVYQINQPKKRDYPMRCGLVDTKLGDINWSTFSNQNLQFAYILATKGNGFTDSKFEDNWEKSRDANIPTGAYHLFRFNVDGKTQGEYFCEILGDSLSGRLIPMVDISIYGIYYITPEDKDKVVEGLTDFLDVVEDKYGVKPIIKCDMKCYNEYISGEFDEYPLWLRSIYGEVDSDIDWDFWEFSDKLRYSGYSNSKKCISCSVCSLGEEDFLQEFVII